MKSRDPSAPPLPVSPSLMADLLESLSRELDLIDVSEKRFILRLSGVDTKQSPLVTKLKVLASRQIITPEECARLTEFATTR